MIFDEGVLQVKHILRMSGAGTFFDAVLLGGSGPCQSQSQTVPKEPSPKALMGVNERTEAV